MVQHHKNETESIRNDSRSRLNQVVRLPKLFDRDIEAKLSTQAHKSYVTKLAACRQYVENHFRSNYNVSAYPVCDILMAIQISGLSKITITSVSLNLAMSENILTRYMSIAEQCGLVTLGSEADDSTVSITKKGEQDLLTITNAISAVAFKLRPLNSRER